MSLTNFAFLDFEVYKGMPSHSQPSGRGDGSSGGIGEGGVEVCEVVVWIMEQRRRDAVPLT